MHIINETVKCYSSLVVSGFSRNEFNCCALFKFYCWFIFHLILRLVGGGGLALYFIFIILFLFSFVDFIVI
jgi:hypothetical protein